jgi:hypothetical protein
VRGVAVVMTMAKQSARCFSVMTAPLERVAKSDAVQAFRPARRGGPEGPHYILQELLISRSVEPYRNI